jgi:apolipoprotein N-acyltransferase
MSPFRFAHHRSEVTLLLAFVACAALALKFGDRVLGWCLVACSAWGLVMSYRLATGAVVPGPRVGYSPAGQFLVAVGLLGLGASWLHLSQDSTIGDSAVSAMMLALIPGILLDARARLRSEHRL